MCQWEKLDVISVASQLGRFDLISSFLTILTVLIAIFGFVGFWMIRSEAIEEAKNASVKKIETIATDIISNVIKTEDIDKYIRKLLHSYVSERWSRYNNYDFGTNISQEDLNNLLNTLNSEGDD